MSLVQSVLGVFGMHELRVAAVDDLAPRLRRLRLSSSTLRGVRAGFIHIPWLPLQAASRHGAPSMALEEMVRGLEIALRVAAVTPRDIRRGAGTLD